VDKVRVTDLRTALFLRDNWAMNLPTLQTAEKLHIALMFRWHVTG